MHARQPCQRGLFAAMLHRKTLQHEGLWDNDSDSAFITRARTRITNHVFFISFWFAVKSSLTRKKKSEKISWYSYHFLLFIPFLLNLTFYAQTREKKYPKIFSYFSDCKSNPSKKKSNQLKMKSIKKYPIPYQFKHL